MPQQTADAKKIPSYRQPSNMNLDFFWKITSKWYFFPLFYIFLVFIFAVVVGGLEGGYKGDFEEVGSIFLLTLYFMPNGLFFFISEIQRFGEDGLYFIFPAVFHLFWIISVIVMQILKYRRNRILKWLILTLIILMVLSFAGCTAMVFTQGGSGSFFGGGIF